MSIFLVYSLGFIGSSLLERLAIDTWLELVLSAVAAFPFIVLICWVLLLTPKLKGMIFNLLVDKIKPKKTLPQAD